MQSPDFKTQYLAIARFQRSGHIVRAIEDTQARLDSRTVKPIEKQQELRFNPCYPQIIDHEADAQRTFQLLIINAFSNQMLGSSKL